MLTGSVASSLQGEPRATHDIDIVAAIHGDDVGRLVALFPPPEYHLDAPAVLEAVSQRSMFNLIQVQEGAKVDFWILTEDPFDQSRFRRRRIERVFGLDLHVSSPEDTILAKLRWAALSGGSEKQFTDALRVFEVQHAGLDMDYLESWAKDLNVQDLWARLKEEARAFPCP